MSNTTPPSLTRHPLYYYDDGNVVIQTQDRVLFRLYGALLRQHSKLWEDCFLIPRPTLPPNTMKSSNMHAEKGPLPGNSSLRNGETDDTAIFIPYNSGTFTDFISVLITNPTMGPGEESRSTQSLVHILQMSHFFDASFVRAFAISGLNARADFSPALRLYCARAFDVKEWVVVGMEHIIYTPITTVSTDDLKLLGTETVVNIQKTKERIAQHRRLCACHIPKVIHENYCSGVGRNLCDEGWGKSWWGEYNRPGVVPFLLRTDVPMRKIVAGLAGMDAGLMADPCREATVYQLSLGAEVGGKLLVEENFIAEAVTKFNRLSGF